MNSAATISGSTVENYFQYFSEIEDLFQRRRGSALLLSTLDWALIETWKEAGIPLQAVLRGIDEAFDRYDQRPSRSRKINSLAYCSQAVLTAAEEMNEAALGARAPRSAESALPPPEIADYLRKNARILDRLASGETEKQSAALPEMVRPSASAAAHSLREMAATLESSAEVSSHILEDMERRLTAQEEKLFSGLLLACPEAELVAVREEAERAMAPYRRQMLAAQIELLQKQYLHKRLLERHGLPRLSLFYMT